MSILLALVACQEIEQLVVVMDGVVTDSPESDGAPLSSATVNVRDAEVVVVGEATTSSAGAFSLEVPGGEPIYMEIEHDDFVTMSFQGSTPTVDFETEPGQLYMVPPSELDTLRETYTNCPQAADAGGVIAGTVRLYAEDGDGNNPVVITAFTTAYDVDGNAFPGCYLDDKGASLADGTVTGATGRFAIFGVPTGPITLEVSYTFIEDVVPVVYYYLWMPDGGFAPYEPAYAYVPT